ncbi:hypothetical protein AB0D66_26915 [Streptomyces sp. NPDC048270]|uniref:hypothetical protein n=1 Tax=Streptomyces sp. NPDC048270 TaxID=3154615 RepID=UPI0033D2FC36
MVLVVEDLHWVDEATRDLLLLARNPPQDLRLVLTYRAEDLPEHGNALGAPYRWPVGVGGTEITLSPFTESEERELAVSVIGPAAAIALGGRLFERSQGLPLVAEEDLLTVADRLARSPADGARSLEAMGVPRALQEALNSRVALLAPEAVAVVAGRRRPGRTGHRGTPGGAGGTGGGAGRGGSGGQRTERDVACPTHPTPRGSPPG